MLLTYKDIGYKVIDECLDKQGICRVSLSYKKQCLIQKMISYYEQIKGTQKSTKPFIWSAFFSLVLLIRFSLFYKGLFDIFISYVSNEVEFITYDDENNFYIELKKK
jgi:hypothetical protein